MTDEDFPLHEPDFDSAALRLTVDLNAVVENWRSMDRLSGAARAGAVVKADAYGFGIEDCGEALHHAGARDFFVMTAEEGATLRAVAPQARIFVLAGLWPGMEPLFFAHDLVPVIASYEQLTHFMAVLAESGPYPCALQVDTGFNRLGLTLEEALDLADDSAMPQAFSPVLVMSHLMCGDMANHPQNRLQLDRFRSVAQAFEGVEASLAASGGIAMGSDYHFDLTRPGIALYGETGGAAIPLPLQTVARAEARILQVRLARAGECVSYGAHTMLDRDTLIAIAAVGYGDGYPRSLSLGGEKPVAEAFLNGMRVPVLGRLTMDMTMFDVTDLGPRSVHAGDYVELFGPNLPVWNLAKAADTIPYEIFTRLGLRYQRNTLPVMGDESGPTGL